LPTSASEIFASGEVRITFPASLLPPSVGVSYFWSLLATRYASMDERRTLFPILKVLRAGKATRNRCASSLRLRFKRREKRRNSAYLIPEKGTWGDGGGGGRALVQIALKIAERSLTDAGERKGLRRASGVWLQTGESGRMTDSRRPGDVEVAIEFHWTDASD
jgi:hypothetical protein